MQCELCGAKIRGPPKIVKIEGAELRVCGQCAHLGTEVQRSRSQTIQKKSGPTPSLTIQRRKPRDVFDFMEGEGEIVDDYCDRIREARMAKGWSQKELALSIKEREVLIKKIEKGDLIPEDDVRKKIEQALEIRLTDARMDDSTQKATGPVTTTFGDLIKIKKGSK
jgi:putative transcription factor